VLRAAGVEAALVPGATCCGQPAWNSGFAADARRVARRTMAALDGLEAVVVPSGSCTAMMRLHWPELFRGDRDQARAERMSARVFELSQYIVEQAGVESVGAPLGRTVSYHDSCHMLRELRLHDPPRRLVRAVAELCELPRSDRCCGFGGAFSVRYPEVATAMADDKLASAAAVGAETVVSADPGCIMHLEGRASRTGAPVRIVHLATLLAEAV
jgi:L-lactate dehydrogenase complex protein LldE